ncbi:MAG: aldehyde dehydrogenase family protein, partial [Solirubrobacteraceae bacterium]|nr:aldehyde dehydrogenase family protein [Solirubrobacteraceae bacterium]
MRSSEGGRHYRMYIEGAADAERAIRAARRAFDEGPWGSATGLERAKLLRDVAARLRERAEEIGGHAEPAGRSMFARPGPRPASGRPVEQQPLGPWDEEDTRAAPQSLEGGR